MKILFAGTPHFSATILLRLADAGYSIVGVLTQPDRRAGRGMILTPSPVKQLALINNWPLFQPITLKDERLQQSLLGLSADVFIVAAYGRLIPKPLLSGFPCGAINVHASLLPRWRGAAPIERAIAEGDTETGISIMHMSEGLDEGPVYREDVLDIGEHETADDLANRLALLGGESILHVLNLLPSLMPEPQSREGIVYAAKITNEDGAIDFTQTASTIYRRIRAFTTNPGCYFQRGDERIRIGAAHLSSSPLPPPATESPAPGTILQSSIEGILVQCADRPIRLIALQRPGRKMMSAEHVLQGFRIGVGQSLY